MARLKIRNGDSERGAELSAPSAFWRPQDVTRLWDACRTGTPSPADRAQLRRFWSDQFIHNRDDLKLFPSRSASRDEQLKAAESVKTIR